MVGPDARTRGPLATAAAVATFAAAAAQGSRRHGWRHLRFARSCQRDQRRLSLLARLTVPEVSPEWAPLAQGAERFCGVQQQLQVSAFAQRAGSSCVAVVKGNVADAQDVPTRLHSECLFGDVFGSSRCDCGAQLHTYMEQVLGNGATSCGILLYLKGQEGKGIGLVNKLRAYALQDSPEQLSEGDANLRLGFPVDARRYGGARAALRSLRVRSITLYTNSSRKASALGSVVAAVAPWLRASQRWGEPSPVTSAGRAFVTGRVARGAAGAALAGHSAFCRFASKLFPGAGQLRRLAGRGLCLQAFQQETEEERLRLDAEARAAMAEHMVRVEALAQAGNTRAQRTAWKWKVRKRIWDYLEDNDLAERPRPVHNRIPNFKGSTEAGKRLAALPEFSKAQVVKVNPDTPQRSVRIAALEQKKVLYVPQPRLRTGFFSRLMPGSVTPQDFRFASTPGGMRQFAQPLGLDDRTKIDIIVVGSTAVNPDTGARVGKGEGFAELEYGILRLLGQIDDSTPVVTCVHDCQVVRENMPPEGISLMKHDVPVDIIVTPTQIFRVDPQKRWPKPVGIYWDLLSREKLNQVKILRTLKEELEAKTGQTLSIAEEEEALPPLAKRGGRGGAGTGVGQGSRRGPSV